MSGIAPAPEFDTWNKAIGPQLGQLSSVSARELLRLKFSPADKRRVRQLSAKANAGELSPYETQELQHYLNVGRALEFIKAKARSSLRGRDAAAA